MFTQGHDELVLVVEIRKEGIPCQITCAGDNYLNILALLIPLLMSSVIC